MAQENAPYKVSEPVVAVMDGLTRFTTRVLTNIRDGNTTIEQLESFLDWFFDISVEDREDMFTPLDETPPFLKLLTQRKPLKISALPGYKLITQHWFITPILLLSCITIGEIQLLLPLFWYMK